MRPTHAGLQRRRTMAKNTGRCGSGWCIQVRRPSSKSMAISIKTPFHKFIGFGMWLRMHHPGAQRPVFFAMLLRRRDPGVIWTHGRGRHLRLQLDIATPDGTIQRRGGGRNPADQALRLRMHHSSVVSVPDGTIQRRGRHMMMSYDDVI